LESDIELKVAKSAFKPTGAKNRRDELKLEVNNELGFQAVISRGSTT
jgi:hypothetical protein